jgi:hypothetical protein
MTEYDYSDAGYERLRLTQERIRKWVRNIDQSPCNQFEHHPERSQTPQPAFYATPQGGVTPTYSRTHEHSVHGHNMHEHSMHGHNMHEHTSSMHRHNMHEHSMHGHKMHEHSMHEHSQRHTPSQRGSPLIMPQARPPCGRSFSSPAPSAGQFSPSNPYTQYPTAPSRNPSQYSPRYQPSQMPHPSRSSSQNSFRSVRSPHMQANPVIQQQHGGNAYPYFQPSLPHTMPQQPPAVVFVVGGKRDFTVVPPPGQYVKVIVSFFFYHVLVVVIHSIVY